MSPTSTPTPAAPSEERGASLVEYVLLLALIVIASLTALTFLGTSNGGSLTRSGDCIAEAPGPPSADCK